MFDIIRGVARGGAEGARAPLEFSRSVNPIQTRGGGLCPSHYCQPPRIQKAIYMSDFIYPTLKKKSRENTCVKKYTYD